MSKEQQTAATSRLGFWFWVRVWLALSSSWFAGTSLKEGSYVWAAVWLFFTIYNGYKIAKMMSHG